MLFFFKPFAFQSEYGIYSLPDLTRAKDAGFLLNKNVFILQMTSKGEFLF